MKCSALWVSGANPLGDVGIVRRYVRMRLECACYVELTCLYSISKK